MPHKLTPTAVANLIQPPDGTPSPVSVEILEALVSILNPREQDEVLRHLGRDHVHRHFPTLLASFTDDLADAAPQTADDTDSEEDREEDLHGSSVFHVSDLEDNDADHDGSSLCPLSDFETPPDSPVLSSTPISTQSAIHVSAAASKGKAREAPVASASRAATADRQLPSTSATTRKYHFSNATESGETDSCSVPGGQVHRLTPKSSPPNLAHSPPRFFFGNKVGVFQKHEAALLQASVKGAKPMLQVGYPSAETAEAAIKHARSKGWTSDTTKGALAAPQPSTDDNPLSAAGPDLCTPLLGLARRPSESFSLLWTPGSSRLSSALAPLSLQNNLPHVLMRDIGLDSDTQPDTSELPSHEVVSHTNLNHLLDSYSFRTPSTSVSFLGLLRNATPNCRNFDELPFTLAAPPPLVSPSLSMPPKSSTPSPDPPEARSRDTKRLSTRGLAFGCKLKEQPYDKPLRKYSTSRPSKHDNIGRHIGGGSSIADVLTPSHLSDVGAPTSKPSLPRGRRESTLASARIATPLRPQQHVRRHPGVVATPAHSCSSSPVTASPCSPPSTPTPPPTEETYYGEDEDAPSDDAGSDDDSDFFLPVLPTIGRSRDSLVTLNRKLVFHAGAKKCIQNQPNKSSEEI
ncbi:hypothetical protein R3P38DRAFT_2773875 [Favolaschia claudopus]|uniref:Uncharacterized protein n=1 Tax=Favolaschia claudopus TaxID=2862362 RepID=A0AAW0BWE9_9AGAR